MKLTDLVDLTPPTSKSIKVCPRLHWTAKLGRAEAQGDDANTAVLKLRQTIERAFDGDYTPRTLTFRGYLGLLCRTPEHWAYTIIPPEKLQKQEGQITSQWCSSRIDSKEEAIKRLRSHMADCVWDGEEEQSPLLVDDPEEQERFTRGVRWQKRFRVLRQMHPGMDEEAIRMQLMQEGL
jgi:hypothetical protein